MTLNFDTDDSADGAAAIGVIVLQNDETLGPEMREAFADVAGFGPGRLFATGSA